MNAPTAKSTIAGANKRFFLMALPLLDQILIRRSSGDVRNGEEWLTERKHGINIVNDFTPNLLLHIGRCMAGDGPSAQPRMLCEDYCRLSNMEVTSSTRHKLERQRPVGQRQDELPPRAAVSSSEIYERMAPRVGLEPTTCGLTVRRSTN